MNAKVNSKTLHEAFVKFFEAPSRETLRDLLKGHFGELKNCDFKENWPEHASIAKHILGIANSAGGCIVFGVKELEDKSMKPVGLDQLKDKADIVNGIKLFLPEPLNAAIEITDFSYSASEYGELVGKKFQVIFIHGRPEAVPLVAQRAGNNIKAGAIYIRREANTEEASYEEVQRLIAQRVASMPQTLQARDLKTHLEELRVLYGQIPETIQRRGYMEQYVSHFETMSTFFHGSPKKNPFFPSEDFDAFVNRMISKKKVLIEQELGITAERPDKG